MDSRNTYSDCPPLLRDFLFYILTIRGRSLRTVNAYHIDLRYFLRYLKCAKITGDFPDNFSEITIDDLPQEVILNVTLSDVYAFLNYLQQFCNNQATTRSRKISALRSFYKYLNTKTSHLAENPLKDLEVPSIRKTMPKYLTLEQSLALLGAIGGKEQERDYCMITLLLNCGMRLSELVNISLNDVRDDTIRLLGKGNKERIIYLNDACMTAISSYLAIRKQPTLQSERDAMFLSGRGKRLSGRRVEQIVEENLRKIGLGGLGYSPHKLRHTAATLMYQHGDVDIRVLKEILGHVNLGTTEIYTHVANKQMANAADASPLSQVKPSKKKKAPPED